VPVAGLLGGCLTHTLTLFGEVKKPNKNRYLFGSKYATTMLLWYATFEKVSDISD
jgi:hypothetical protein